MRPNFFPRTAEVAEWRWDLKHLPVWGILVRKQPKKNFPKTEFGTESPGALVILNVLYKVHTEHLDGLTGHIGFSVRPDLLWPSRDLEALDEA